MFFDFLANFFPYQQKLSILIIKSLKRPKAWKNFTQANFFSKKYSSFWKNDGEILLNCSIKLKKVTVAITPYISPYWLLTFQVILFLCIMHINPIMLLNISARTTLHSTLPLAFCCTIHVHTMTLNTLNDQKNSF